jgi:hypothetical protein
MRDKMNDPARLALMVEAIGNIEEFLSSVESYWKLSGASYSKTFQG